MRLYLRPEIRERRRPPRKRIVVSQTSIDEVNLCKFENHSIKRRVMMSKRIALFWGVFMAFVLMLSACAPAATPTEAPAPTTAPQVQPTTVPPPVDPIAEMLQAAQKEGTIVSYGLPDDWVNYGGLFKGFSGKYNITHQDTDMDSGTIISTLESEAAAPVADTTDLGLAFAKLVEDNKLSQPYQNSHWAEIPDYA